MTNVYVFRSLLFHYDVNIKENAMYIFLYFLGTFPYSMDYLLLPSQNNIRYWVSIKKRLSQSILACTMNIFSMLKMLLSVRLCSC